jgi:outer membrane protein OmpA-like peptidoglycan-associated protein
VPLVLIGAALWGVRSCREAPVVTQKEVIAPADDAVAKAGEAAANASAAAVNAGAAAVNNAAAALGAFVKRNLPDGVELNVPENGIESRLIAFLDSAGAVDDKTWFSFDRLEFDTASATLRPSSEEQLKNIAAIMKAYPNVNIKIGGYTDNVGDPAANLRLSQDRANSTMARLVKLGVSASRMAAEGYGEQFPEASNDTEEGRQRNRRIDVRVIKK